MTKDEMRQLAISKTVLIVLAVLSILIVIWLAWLHPDAKNGAINSFKECAAAGNPIQDSYPQTCVAKNGQRFTNPAQNIQQLTISEWGVSVMLTGIKDGYYEYNTDEDTVIVSTQTLDAALRKIDGCTSGLHGATFERLQPGDPNEVNGGTWTADALERSDATRLGDAFYQRKPLLEAACMPNMDEPAVKQAEDIAMRIKSTTISQ
jgi:hypothetical protein